MNFRSLFSFLLLTITVCGQPDPCLEYEAGTSHCKSCSDGLKLALINETTTLCAYSDKVVCSLNHSFYQNDPAFQSSFEYLTTQTAIHEYCFNCTTFFSLPDGRNKCYSGCPQHVPVNVMSLTTDEQSIGCHVCALEEYQMQTVLDYRFIGTTVKTCTKTIEDTACSFQDYYDSAQKRCIACVDKYHFCSSCNEQKCIIPIFQYYEGLNFYNYSSNKFEIDKLQFYLCSAGTAGTINGNKCIPTEIANCVFPYVEIDGSIICFQCTPGYKYVDGGCTPLVQASEGFKYFIKSGAPYNSTSQIELDLTFSDGSSIDDPLYFLSTAIQDSIQKGTTYHFVNATFFLSKGDHFFFYCNNRTGTIFNSPDIIKYCESYLPFFKQDPVFYDNITMKIQPLYCSLGLELGLTSNENFWEMCVDSSDPNPTIYMNQAYGYFEIFGSATFENLHFSGVNQLVQPVINTNDLSTLPIKYCDAIREPGIGSQELDLEKVYHEDFNIKYKCTNVNYTGSKIPEDLDSHQTCDRNKYSQYYREQESTFSCSGEPSYYYYFYYSHYFVSYRIAARRVNTVFILISLPQYQTGYQRPPELNLINCTFEYFLSNYESLVSIQNQDIQFLDFFDYMPYVRELDTFHFENIGERGARIKIVNSEFKHSSFCKGLVVYRKQHYLDNDAYGYGNFSYIFMTKPFLNDSGSYIALENSRFSNINSGFQNISALALYGGQEVWREIIGDGTILKYQGFLHKGSILNIEDFGGYIHIANCTFQYIMHYIPSIISTPLDSLAKLSISDFADNSQTNELKLSICDGQERKDKFFFTHGLSSSDDIEQMYDDYERLSTIYISRNREAVIIKNNTFHSNIGTFGGAISINSQNWQAGKQPYLIIEGNNFTNNMAYMSGNAIYVRNSIHLSDQNAVCGGIELVRNNFQDNIGGSVYSNGGAVSISCKLLTLEYQDDYFSSSSQYFADPQSRKEELVTFTNPHTQQAHQVHLFTVNIDGNTFRQNLGGQKGSALFVKNINSVKIQNCLFEENGPLLSQLEIERSPYYKYLSQRSIVFTDLTSTCSDEFDYLTNCQNMGKPPSSWSHVKGAIYVEHCQARECYDSYTVMDSLISHSTFKDNQVGYLVDEGFPYTLSSQIKIIGGYNNTIDTSSFNDIQALYSGFIPQKLKDFFPEGYFNSQQASLISIAVETVDQNPVELRNTIKNCTFWKNKHFQVLGLSSANQYQGSLIRITAPNAQSNAQQIQLLSIENCSFIGNTFIGHYAQLIYSFNSLLHISDSIFNQNGGTLEQELDLTFIRREAETLPFTVYNQLLSQEYGILYIEGNQRFESRYTHVIENNTFTNTFSERSCLIHINFGNQFLNMSNNQLSNNIALVGGAITSAGELQSILYGNIDDESLKISNSTLLFEHNAFHNHLTYEGIFNFKLSEGLLQLNLIIRNSSFGNNYFSNDHSLVSLRNMRKVHISESSFYLDFQKDAIKTSFTDGVQNSINELLFPMIEKVFLSNSEAYFTGSKFLEANATHYSQETLFFSDELIPISDQYPEYIEILDCDFENFSTPSTGALIKLNQDSKLLMYNKLRGSNRVRNCQVGKNGIIYVQGSKFIGINLEISHSRSNFSTSLLYLTQDSVGQLQNSSFSDNYAYTYGMIYITGSSQLFCDSCDFRNNSVELDSSIIYADNNPSGFITINNSYFGQNTAASNLFSMVQTETTIENSVFIDNFAKFINNGITFTNSQLLLRNVTVNYTDYDFIHKNSLDVDVCFFNINFQATLTIENSHIENCRGSSASVLIASGYSSVFIRDNSRFLNNWAASSGEFPAMSFSIVDQVIIESAYFSGNTQVDVAFERTNAILINTTFENTVLQHVQSIQSNVNITGCTFKNSRAESQLGTAVRVLSPQLVISNSTFQNLSAAKGGALYLSSTDRDGLFLVEHCTFIQNKAQQGGAIFVQDSPHLVLKNNTFKQNEARQIHPPNIKTITFPKKGLGGAIFLQCQNSRLNLYNNCVFELIEGNLFAENVAQHDGGGILRASNEILSDDSNQFINNQAFYGNDIASYPSHLVIIFMQNNDYYNPINNTEILQTEALHNLHFPSFVGVVSGIPFSFLIYIIDQHGEIYYTDNESIATLKNTNPDIEVLLNGNEIQSHNGVFNFTAVTAIIEPGQNITLQLEITGMYDFGLSIPFLESPTQIDVSFRTCVSGEQMLNFACESCPARTYLYEAPKVNTNCKMCDEDVSVCEGGNIVYPKSSFWRNDSYSETWITCPRKESCLEGTKNKLTQNCQEGYEGIVCGQCIQGYSKTGDFECSKCPEKVNNILKISFILLLCAVIVVGLVFSTLHSSGKAKSKTSVYIKIMTSHLQIISALANVSFSWPHYIENLYETIISVSQISEQMFSIDCFLEDATSPLVNSIGLYFTKLLLYALLPFLLALLDLLFWIVFFTCKKQFKNFASYFTSTLVILLFLVHPTITQAMFQAFNCVKIGKIYYLRGDIQFECYTGQHLRFLVMIVIPSVIIWCIGIPLFALITLLKSKQLFLKEGKEGTLTEEEQEKMSVLKMKYGFIFNGFKPEQFFYEVVIQYRKVLLIMITVIFSVVSSEIQALLSFIVLIGSMVYQFSKKPFLTDILNRMELLSLSVASTTMYAGMYFITGQHYDYYQNMALQWIFLFLLLLPNLAFLFYWLYFMGLECLKTAHQKNQRLFCLLSLGLCNYEKFKEHHIQIEQQPQVDFGGVQDNSAQSHRLDNSNRKLVSARIDELNHNIEKVDIKEKKAQVSKKHKSKKTKKVIVSPQNPLQHKESSFLKEDARLEVPKNADLQGSNEQQRKNKKSSRNKRASHEVAMVGIKKLTTKLKKSESKKKAEIFDSDQ